MTNAADMLSQAAAVYADRPAIIDAWGTMTFGQLEEAAQRLARSLRVHGVAPRQGLGVMARNGRGFVIGVFAGLRCGATVMPLSHQQKEYELACTLRDAPLHAILSDGVGPNLASQCAGVQVVSDGWLLGVLPADRARPFVPEVPDAAFVRFTSGTTAQSKGVVVSHRAVWERTAAAQNGLQLTLDDRIVWVLPMAFHFIVSIMLYVRYAITMIICRDILAQTILTQTERHRGTLLYASPMHFRILAADQSGMRLDTLRLALSTSSAIAEHVSRAFSQRYGHPVAQAYGIIEVGLPLANLHAPEEAPASVGLPLPGYQTAILAEDGQLLPAGSTGKLGLRGPGMFDGYMNPAVSCAESLWHGWFLTGDLACRDESGRIYIRGREKSMINVSGNKVFPEEVEAVLEAYPGVAGSRVSGRPHPLMGEIVVAQVVMSNSSALEVEALLGFCRQRLSTYKVPQFVEGVPSLDLTPTGKLRRTQGPL